MSVDAETLKAIETLRAAYVAAGSKRGAPCHSVHCLQIATVRVFWPVLPDEEYPVYCADCAAWAQRILETMGHRYRDEKLPVLTTEQTRLIEL